MLPPPTKPTPRATTRPRTGRVSFFRIASLPPILSVECSVLSVECLWDAEHTEHLPLNTQLASLRLRTSSFAKDRAADAHHRRPFFDRYGEVVAHAHRQLTQRRIGRRVGPQPIAELPQGPEV